MRVYTTLPLHLHTYPDPRSRDKVLQIKQLSTRSFFPSNYILRDNFQITHKSYIKGGDNVGKGVELKATPTDQL